MSSEAVKVVVRCRPLNRRETDLQCQCIISMDGSRGQCSIINPNEPKAPPKHFFFDGSYFLQSTTEQIYADIAYPLVEGVTEGYNGTIFAYGQTGCGKSFTMQGISDPPTQRGMIPRAFEHIFETIAISDKSRYLVHASYLEIYNEEIRDLLGKDVKAKMDLKEHPEKGVYVAGLSMHKVTNVRECQIIMERGWKNRSTGATLMNQDSSRSHSIFSISLERTDNEETGDEEQHIRAGKLNLVDLAGSERQSKSGATGERLKEATKINLSLSALGNVISALVDGKSKHIPYRDSKLTRLLQDSLGGNTKTLMVACLSPADNNFDETLSTLRYANRAKNIQNKPKINEDPKDALLREYQEEIERLKMLLMNQGGPSLQQPTVTVNTMEIKTREVDPAEIERQKRFLEDEKERIRREYEERLKEKEHMYKSEAADKARLMEEMKKLRQYYDAKMEKLDERYQHFPIAPIETTEHVRSKKGDTNGTLVPWRDHSSPRMEPPAVNFSDGIASSVLIVNKNGDAAPILGSAPPLDDGFFEDDQDSQQASDVSSAEVHASLNQPGRHAKHVRSHPSSRAEASANLPVDRLGKEELLKRLQNLESGMVGGEQSANKDLKERHRRRTRHVQKRMQQFREATKDMDGEEIIADIFSNIQDEVRYKNKMLEKEKEKVRELQQDIDDLHMEFERDRTDYLDTIREQEKRLKLYQSIVDKMVAGVRRDCNYTNIDRIISMSKWNSDKEQWAVPPLTIEKVHLPPTGDEQMGPPRTTYKHRNPRGDEEYGYPDDGSDNRYGNDEEDRLYQKLAARENAAQDYFTNKRANKLLQSRAQMDDVQSQDSYGYGGRSGGMDDYPDIRGMNPARRQLDVPYNQEDNFHGGMQHSYSTPDEMNMVRRPGNRLGVLDTSAVPRSAMGSRRTNRQRNSRNDYS